LIVVHSSDLKLKQQQSLLSAVLTVRSILQQAHVSKPTYSRGLPSASDSSKRWQFPLTLRMLLTAIHSSSSATAVCFSAALTSTDSTSSIDLESNTERIRKYIVHAYRECSSADTDC
jgi:hypothetical protein